MDAPLKIVGSADMEAPIRKLDQSGAEAHAQYRKLLDYIEKHQMQMIGFSREITLIDYGITNDTEKFVTEICIPVRCE